MRLRCALASNLEERLVSVDGGQLAEADGSPPRASMAGAVVCAGAALLLVVATAYVTFGLAESYGFGPWWDWSAFVMTAGVALLTGAGFVAAARLARVRWRPVSVLAAVVGSVFVIGYVAGVLGNVRHH